MSSGKEYRSEELLLPHNMLRLYAMGAFPMADEETGDVEWYMPETRAIIPLEGLNMPRSLRKFLEREPFEFRYDDNPLGVVHACAERRETWINKRLIRGYEGLLALGALHSVETRQGGKLVGGLYGVTYKGAFFGESMFSRVSQASKAALVKLVERLRARGFRALDVQFLTDHLAMFGAREIDFPEYQDLLRSAYEVEPTF